MDFITASVLADSLGVSYGTAANILRAVEGGTKVGNTTIYPRSYVQAHLLRQNEKLLKFLQLDPSPVHPLDDCDCKVCPKCQKGE